MALTAGDVTFWAELARLGAIPPAPHVLEIGQANWYGDVPPPAGCEDACPFAVARKWYRKVLGYQSIIAIDMHGRDALALDLNKPLPLSADVTFDLIINTGTLEHVFDQRQAFQTIHERCKTGGLMVHAAPTAGWKDHGFYVYSPCLFTDLARANAYEWVFAQAYEFGQGTGDVMQYSALRKAWDVPFRVPQQKKYR